MILTSTTDHEVVYVMVVCHWGWAFVRLSLELLCLEVVCQTLDLSAPLDGGHQVVCLLNEEGPFWGTYQAEVAAHEVPLALDLVEGLQAVDHCDAFHGMSL